jgi:hypothetical protein
MGLQLLRYDTEALGLALRTGELCEVEHNE